MSTIKEMREVCQHRSPNAKGKMVWTGYWFDTLFTRHISIYFTWLFIKMGFSANIVTLLMIPVGLIGAALCVLHVLWLNILGIFLLAFVVVLDCSDGEVARWTKKSSIRGCYLDLVYHVLCLPAKAIICPLHLYFWNGEVKYLAIAFICCALANCAQTMSFVYKLALSQVSKETVQTDKIANIATKPTATAAKKTSIACIIKRVIALPTDHTVSESASKIAILLIYAGITVPAVFLSYFFVFLNLMNLLRVTISGHHKLPKISHIKQV